MPRKDGQSSQPNWFMLGIFTAVLYHFVRTPGQTSCACGCLLLVLILLIVMPIAVLVVELWDFIKVLAGLAFLGWIAWLIWRPRETNQGGPG